MKQRAVATVQRNSHVTLNKHHYSVPVQYVGKRVNLVYDTDIIDIFHGFAHLATHHRNDKPYEYTTKPSHNLPGADADGKERLTPDHRNIRGKEFFAASIKQSTNQPMTTNKMGTNDKTTPITPEKDRNAISMGLMLRMRLHGMAAAFTESLQSTFAETMTPDSFLNWLFSREWDYRATRNIERLVKNANFRYGDASMAQIDYTLPRGLDRNQMERLASLDFVRKGDNLFFTVCAQVKAIWRQLWATRPARPACEFFTQTPPNSWAP